MQNLVSKVKSAVVTVEEINTMFDIHGRFMDRLKTLINAHKALDEIPLNKDLGGVKLEGDEVVAYFCYSTLEFEQLVDSHSVTKIGFKVDIFGSDEAMTEYIDKLISDHKAEMDRIQQKKQEKREKREAKRKDKKLEKAKKLLTNNGFTITQIEDDKGNNSFSCPI